ncbi:CoA-disulfide reductase [bacterium]|nr:CoA-disulfide reductase [bacterium]
MENKKERLLIVGGVAGGASCAARARRMNEDVEIIVFERGSFVSFANCGLPYFVGDVIENEKNLLVATPELFRQRFNIEVRLRNEVLSIDRQTQTIKVRERDSGKEYEERYDDLVLATGASAIRPPVPGIDLPGIFTVRTIPESRMIRSWLSEYSVKQAVVIGGGFIGLEITENLINKDIDVSIIDKGDQILTPLDPEMTSEIEKRLKSHGVELYLGEGVTGFSSGEEDKKLIVHTDSGKALEADLIILGVGVRPNSALAKEAGLEVGATGGIVVTPYMNTSDPHIWAVGDVTENANFVTGEKQVVALAGPANRQGRIAADNIFGQKRRYRGTQATAVCGILGLTAAATGVNEKSLKKANIKYEKVYLHPGHHVGYYPNAKPVHLKVLYAKEDGKLLGAQAIGEEGIDKRMDVISMALQLGGTVFDLEEAELCYAPQYGAAKDPVNIAGMIAANQLRGYAPLAHWNNFQLTDSSKSYFLDVRNPSEFESGHIDNAVNIPLHDLRDRLDELPEDRPILVYCRVGQRGYYATRMLRIKGLDAYNLSGGIITQGDVKEPALKA